MGTYQTDAIFGDADNSSALMPGEWNPTGQDATDIGQIIADGVRNIGAKILNASVGEKFNDGQLLRTTSAPMPRQQGDIMPLLVIGAIVYLISKG